MKKEKIIEIQKPVKIEQEDSLIFLEKGDKVKIIENINHNIDKVHIDIKKDPLIKILFSFRDTSDSYYLFTLKNEKGPIILEYDINTIELVSSDNTLIRDFDKKYDYSNLVNDIAYYLSTARKNDTIMIEEVIIDKLKISRKIPNKVKIIEARGASYYASSSPGHYRYAVTLAEHDITSDETEFTYYGSFDNIKDAKERVEDILPYIEYNWEVPYGPMVDFYIMDKEDRKNTIYYIKSNKKV